MRAGRGAAVANASEAFEDSESDFEAAFYYGVSKKVHARARSEGSIAGHWLSAWLGSVTSLLVHASVCFAGSARGLAP